MRSCVLVSLFAIPVAAACAMAPRDTLNPGGDPQGSEAKAYFNANVRSVFEVNCSSCHARPDNAYGAPAFLGTSPDGYYDKLVERRDFVSCDVGNSMLLLKGADPGHVGVPLAPGDAPKVETWLGMEAEARFGGVCSNPEAPLPPDSTTTSTTTGTATAVPEKLTGQKAMEMFGDCSTYTDWVDSGMPLVAQQTALYQGNDVACYQCHTNPNTGSNHMPDPDQETQVKQAFQNMRYMYRSFNLVRWTVSQTDGSFEDLVQSYRWRDKGLEQGEHPKYTLTPERVAYYDDWFQRTYTRWREAVDTGVPCEAAAGDPPP